jgi:hypothetical protein
MTKKDYTKFAGVLARVLAEVEEGYFGGSMAEVNTAHEVVRALQDRLETVFCADNARFNRDRFRDAVKAGAEAFRAALTEG